MNALYFTGFSLVEAGRHREAAHALRFLLLCEPLHVEAWQALGTCHEQLDDPEGAARVFETGFRMGGMQTSLGLLAARALVNAGDASAAARLMEELSELELSEAEQRAANALNRVVERRA